MDNLYVTLGKNDTGFFHKAFRILAVLMIVGVILPILSPSFDGKTLSFINFQLFGGEGVSFWIRIGAVYPLLAGIAILILLARTDIADFKKAVSIFFISVLPVLFIVFKSNYFDGFGTGIMGSMIQSSGLYILGILLILIAGIIVMNKNLSLTAQLIGAIGGFFFILYLLVPIQMGLLGIEKSPISAFFELVGFEHSTAGAMNIMGICLVISSAFLVASSAYCFLLFQVKYKNEETGKKITKYWVWSQLVVFIGMAYSIITSITDFTLFIMVLLISIKLVIMLYSILLLVAFASSFCLSLLPQSSLSLNTILSTPGGGFPDKVQEADDLQIRMVKLKEIFDKGLIKEEEYNEKRKRLLEDL